ncbi:MAG: enoyl-CoA hydratase/isomerase family protein [Myxococcota bacterium]
MSAVSVLGEGAVRTLLIDRPEAKNALDIAAIDAIGVVLDQLQTDESLAVLILAGGGGHFVSGGDLKDLRRIQGSQAALELSQRASRCFSRFFALPAVVIAAIDGAAYGGGCELALYADLRVASAEARLVWKQLELGLMTGFGGGQLLLRQVGYSQAMLWLSTAAAVGAEEALRAGLVDRVAPPGVSARAEAERIGAIIAGMPRASLAAQKAALIQGRTLPLAEATALEARAFAQTWGSEAHITALDRFFSRKAP